MTHSGWIIQLSEPAKESLRLIRVNYPNVATHVVRMLFRFEENPFPGTRPSEPPDPPDLHCYDFAVGTLQFVILLEYGDDEQTIQIQDIRVVGYA